MVTWYTPETDLSLFSSHFIKLILLKMISKKRGKKESAI
jgi:hypothetical protein